MLTGREQLTMYARIKGLDEKIIPETVSAFLQMLDLGKYADRNVGGYPLLQNHTYNIIIVVVIFFDKSVHTVVETRESCRWQ